MKQSRPYSGTQSVLRAVSILKAFSDVRPEWTLAELVRELGLNKTTAFRLLSALESEGVIARNQDTGAYRLGPEIIALGGVAARSNDLRTASLRELQRLAQQAGEAATLEVLVGSEVLIVEEVGSAHLVSSSQSVGTRHPAHATSTGKMLLSELDAAELRLILPSKLAQITDKTITDFGVLTRQLGEIRVRGYAVALEELELAYAAVSVPVRNHHGQICAAICVGGPISRLVPEKLPELAGILKEAAGRISANLGFRPSTDT